MQRKLPAQLVQLPTLAVTKRMREDKQPQIIIIHTEDFGFIKRYDISSQTHPQNNCRTIITQLLVNLEEHYLERKNKNSYP